MKLSLKNREEYTYHLFLSIKKNDREQFRKDFLQLHPNDQIDFFLECSKVRRASIYKFITPIEFSEVFSWLEIESQKEYIMELEDEYAIKMLEELPADDITDFLGEIPDHIAKFFLKQMDKEEADNIKLLMSYKPDTAGSMMTTEFISILPNQTVASVLEQLRNEGKDAETIYYLYVLDQSERLIGVVSLRDLITSDGDQLIKDLMKEQVVSVSALTDQEEVAAIFRDYDLLAVPVVTTEEKLIGIVTVDDIIDVMEDEVSEDIGEISAAKGTLDINVNALTAAKKRLPWLITLLVIGMFTAGLISTFEATLTEVALLAIFIPLIADMAGNTGTQSLAVVVRGLALGSFDREGVWKLIKRESMTGLIMGIACGLAISLISLVIPSANLLLGFIVGVSLLFTVFISTITGTIIPLVINRLKIDPAIASGPFITTINDIIGLFIYFSIATSLLHYL